MVVAVLLLLLAAVPHRQAPCNTLNRATREGVAEYIAWLGGTVLKVQDALALQEDEKAALSRLLTALGTWETVVLFNGDLCRGVALQEGDKEWILKPSGKEQAAPGLSVISKEPLDMEATLESAGTPVEGEILRAFVTRAEQSAPDAAFLDQIRTIIRKGVTDGAISDGFYDAATDTLSLAYGSDEFPCESNPRLTAEALLMLAAWSKDPHGYAQKAHAVLSERIENGEVLVVDTGLKGRAWTFLPRRALERDLRTLRDETLTGEEKIRRISEGLLFYGSDGSSGSTAPLQTWAGNFGLACAQQAAQGSDTLLESEGPIVPPARRIAFLRGPDYNMFPYLTKRYLTGVFSGEYQKIRDPNGVLSPFLQNGFSTPEIHSAYWGEPFVETLAQILSDDSISIVYMQTHGLPNELLAEMYDLGEAEQRSSDGKVDEFRQRIGVLKSRIQKLRSSYGVDAITLRVAKTSLTKEELSELNQYLPQIPDQAQQYLRSRRKFGLVVVTDKFFDRLGKKKALFILRACYGGSMADNLKARVILAPSENNFTTEGIFLSDLEKLAPYLRKDRNAGPIVIDKGNMRNYEIVRSFAEPPDLPDGLEAGEENSRIREATGRKDRLCSIRLWGPKNRTVTPSPHVVYADGERIVFNAPMDTSVPAEEVIELDCSSFGKEVPEATSQKPHWVSDREIALPWKGTVYRDWEGKDFYENGSPESNFVNIIVRNGTAVSRISRIPLSGNTDLCTRNNWKSKDAWKDFAAIEYSGNHPRTDFTMMFPLIKEPKPPASKTPTVPGGAGHILYPDESYYCKNLLMDGNKIIDGRKSYEDYRKAKMENPSAPATFFSFSEFLETAAFEGHYAYGRETEGDESFRELFIDGKAVYRGPGTYSGLQLVGGSHLYWVTEGGEGTRLVYNGRSYDAETLGPSHMSSTSLISMNSRFEVRVNGSHIGKAKIGSTLATGPSVHISNHCYETYPYGAENEGWAYAPSGVFLFKDNAAFIDQDGNGRLYRGTSGQTIDLGKAMNIFLFADHVVTVRQVFSTDSRTGPHGYNTVHFDGRDLGQGDHPIIYGDHLAFATSCNPKEKKGPPYEQPWQHMKRDHKVPYFTDGNRFIFLDGIVYDVGRQLRLTTDCYYQVPVLFFFDGKLAFVLVRIPPGGGDIERRLIYDWKDIGPMREGYFRFQGHELYTKDVNGERHIIYDGANLGRGSNPVMFGNHICYFSTTGDQGLHIVYDGKSYKCNASIYGEIRQRFKYFLETQVPSSGYGTLDFSRKQEKR
jgi:hypothetical protein